MYVYHLADESWTIYFCFFNITNVNSGDRGETIILGIQMIPIYTTVCACVCIVFFVLFFSGVKKKEKAMGVQISYTALSSVLLDPCKLCLKV